MQDTDNDELTPAQVMQQVAQAIPQACRANVIIIGSLAAGYRFFRDDRNKAIRTKDVDAMFSPHAMPAGVPRDVVNKASVDLNAALKTPAVRDRILNLGAIPTGMTPEEFAAFFRSESDKWHKVARMAKVIE